MKKQILTSSMVIISLTLLMSCQPADQQKTTNEEVTSAQPATLSATEKEEAKKAISARIVEIIEGAKKLSADSALKPYANIPEFKIINPDGSVLDYNGMVKYQTSAFKDLTSMEFRTVREEFTFLEKDLITCTWIGSCDFVVKTGEKMKINPYVGSMTFRKKDNVWQIIYAHETSAAPVIVE